jgi:hypothetical protein
MSGITNPSRPERVPAGNRSIPGRGGINKMQREEEAPEEAPTTRKCRFCISEIPIEATRCAHCTSPF